ncbi:MAG: cytochrome C oxidase subunit IV family protein [Chloroflexota bacterium]|nr:cytochrome C oxidase subunit IV family protein [Anaerolineae bacterium]
MSDIAHNPDTGAQVVDPHDDHDEQFSFVGRTFPVPVYTGVFAVLGVTTLIEVAISQIFERSTILIIIMLALATFKAGLVVWFYMHLNKDNRIFLACLMIPVVLVVIAVLFLSIVPTGGYS